MLFRNYMHVHYTADHKPGLIIRDYSFSHQPMSTAQVDESEIFRGHNLINTCSQPACQPNRQQTESQGDWSVTGEDCQSNGTGGSATAGLCTRAQRFACQCPAVR